MIEIPASLDAIDAAWLTQALQQAGHDVTVSGVDCKTMPGTIGVLGDVGILTLDYGADTRLPPRMLAKCARDDDIARLYNSIMLFYEREMGFYRDLVDEVPLNAPQPWLTLSDEHRHLLLTDYIDDRQVGDAVTGANVPTMRRLLSDIAGLHGRYWMDRRLADLEWMFSWRNEEILIGAPFVQAFWEQGLEKFPDLVPSDMAAVCWDYHVRDSAWHLDKLARRPWTFVHGDYHLDNMLFTDSPDESPIVVDWQGCMVSFPGYDVGYLLATSRSDETVTAEDELLDHYRTELAAAGGPEWSRDELLDDLAWAMLYFVPGQLIPLQQDYSSMGDQAERTQQRFEKNAQACIDAAMRWDMVDRVRASGLR